MPFIADLPKSYQAQNHSMHPVVVYFVSFNLKQLYFHATDL